MLRCMVAHCWWEMRWEGGFDVAIIVKMIRVDDVGTCLLITSFMVSRYAVKAGGQRR